MSAAKQEVEELLRKLPDECTLEDIQYHLYVMEKSAPGNRCGTPPGRRLPRRGREAPGQVDYIVTWSPAALDDVDAIAEFIAQDSPAYASAVVDKIVDASAS